MKEAHESLVRPVREYENSVWDPYTLSIHEQLQRMQNRAARFVTRYDNNEEGSKTGFLGQLNGNL